MPTNYGVYSPQFQPQQANDSIVVAMVNGDSGALNYPVAAGRTALLLDFQSRKFWLKSTEFNGMPQPLRRFSFEEDAVQNGQSVDNYATREELQEIKSMLAETKKMLEELSK